MKDTQIIELLKSSNYTKAGEKLYGYFPVVQKLVLKNSGSKQDAEDIYQEALIILVRKVQTPGFVLTSSLNTYVYGICRFLWKDRLKQRNRTFTADTQQNIENIPENEFTEWQEEESEIQLAEQAVRLLGEKCRQLLQLFYFKKMSLKEIARKMKFSDKVASTGSATGASTLRQAQGSATYATIKNQKYRCLEKAKQNLINLKSGK